MGAFDWRTFRRAVVVGALGRSDWGGEEERAAVADRSVERCGFAKDKFRGKEDGRGVFQGIPVRLPSQVCTKSRNQAMNFLGARTIADVSGFRVTVSTDRRSISIVVERRLLPTPQFCGLDFVISRVQA
ncbi:hypothetical protein HYN69_13035 [Gemmobacter aquarius]|uniref:Uncharacterized protein n=1 Tax=Paragemmobacter aquarius TaxID=2169400 RepID=A0A2S0UNB4_9RHOB|nr:hypothetical protein HYN69_13035 [Gemmobacter aquarius]